MSFDPVDLRPGQREYLNVMYQRAASPRWTIDTFAADDFDPGFSTELDATQQHVVHVTMFADNAATITRSLQVKGVNRDDLELQPTESDSPRTKRQGGSLPGHEEPR
jgi:hypothetical protein